MPATYVFECEPPSRGVVVLRPEGDPVVASLPCEFPVASVVVEFATGPLVVSVSLSSGLSDSALAAAADAAAQARRLFVAVSTFYFDPPRLVDPPPAPPTWAFDGPFFPAREEPSRRPPYLFGDALKSGLESGIESSMLLDAYVDALGIDDSLGQFLVLWGLVGSTSPRKSVSGIDDHLASMGVPQDRPSGFMVKHPLWTEYGELRNRISHMGTADSASIRELVDDVSARIASFRLWTRGALIGI